ncbi:uncharacterized protein VICG_00983 [Vittaforma corneae ATCC 50505]|uniref:Uncharacterized protein n=1 Tax=Vittaforma corneae (strain ATCC 50505) TaxID=993615 RepID=L2GM96_VITCO|nr:uncharacterized protein VICG_00983 [Vittaforma corneae ATCC 50505]ELA41966.1 hypothetical protein VICG_00983 [Vittaforma corneae ATCC 50505]
MKYRSVPCIIAFVPLFCAIEETPQEGLEALVSEFYREYSDIQLLNARRFIQYFNEDTCQKEDGYVDFENKVMPLLSCMDSRFKPTRNITAAAWDVDLSAVQKQFQRLIDTNFFHKDTLAHGSADNPMLKQAGINSRKSGIYA